MRMNLKSVVARVTRRATKDNKIPLKAYGVVWGESTPIKKVKVQLDMGNWREAIQPTAADEIALKKTYWEAYQQWPGVIDIKV